MRAAIKVDPVFLIVTAWQVISDILLHGLSILNSVLGAVTYVAGVRSLFELATHLLSRGAATMPSGDDSLPRHLAKFFSMRPFLSLGDIKVFWWLYILVELHRLYLRLGTFTFGGNLPPPLYPYMSPNVLVAPLMTLTTIATARLFLEVVMFGPAEAPTEVAAFTRKPGTLSDGLKDFLNLRPFFTPARLQVFWWLFVFTVAANICDYLYLSWGQHILRWVMFVMPFLKPLYCVAGVRLLIEVARRGDRSAVQ